MDRDGAGKVSWDEFDAWWGSRFGAAEAACPVLPEALVRKIDETVAAQGDGRGWNFLRPRLLQLVRMQAWWGSVHDLYAAAQESLFGGDAMPACVRRPGLQSRGP